MFNILLKRMAPFLFFVLSLCSCANEKASSSLVNDSCISSEHNTFINSEPSEKRGCAVEDSSCVFCACPKRSRPNPATTWCLSDQTILADDKHAQLSFINEEAAAQCSTMPAVQSSTNPRNSEEKASCASVIKKEQNDYENNEDSDSDNENSYSPELQRVLDSYYSVFSSVNVVDLTSASDPASNKSSASGPSADPTSSTIEKIDVDAEITSYMQKREVIFRLGRSKVRQINYGIYNKHDLSDIFLFDDIKEPLESQKTVSYYPNRTKEYKERLYYRFKILLYHSETDDFDNNHSQSFCYRMNTQKLNCNNECLPTKDEYNFITGGVFNDEELVFRYYLFVEAYKIQRFSVKYAFRLFRFPALDLIEEHIYTSTQIDNNMLSCYLNATIKRITIPEKIRCNKNKSISSNSYCLVASFFYASKDYLRKTFIEKNLSINHNCFKAFLEIFSITSNQCTILRSEIHPKIQSAILFYTYRDLVELYTSADMNELDRFAMGIAKSVFKNRPKGVQLKISTRLLHNLVLFSEIFFAEKKKEVCLNYVSGVYKKKVVEKALLSREKILLADKSKIDEFVLELLEEIYKSIDKI